MRRLFAWTAAGSVFLGGMTMTLRGADPAPTSQPSALLPGGVGGTAMGMPRFPAGIEQKDLRESKDIYKTIATATEAAMTKGGFYDVCKRLVDQDRDRLKEFADQKFDDLDGRVAQLQKAWKDKYNQDFKIKDREAVFDQRFALIQGEITDPQTVAANWPVPAWKMEKGGREEAQPAAANQQANDKEAKVDKGRNVAIFGIPQTHGMPELYVSMIHELPDNWRIDIPNTISGQRLHDSLLTHLTYVGEHMDQWPADVNDAYRMVAHHVIMALYDVPMSQSYMEKSGG